MIPMITITNESRYPKYVNGTRLEPGDSAEFETDDIDADELHYSLVVEHDEHTCDECGRSFDSEQGLKTHRTQSHGGDN